MPADQCRSGGECYNFCLNCFKYFIARCHLFDASDNWLRWPGLQRPLSPAAEKSCRLAFGTRKQIDGVADTNLVCVLLLRLKYQAMKFILCAIFLLFTMSAAAQNTGEFNIKAAQRFANLALACVHKEYPNHISHTLNGDADAAPPRKLTPAFYGCYDWHSSIHGHWLLVRLVRTLPDAPFVQAAREALRQSLTAENIAQEAAYLRGEGRATFERPYGLAFAIGDGTDGMGRSAG
jgi:hypothetical protein